MKLFKKAAIITVSVLLIGCGSKHTDSDRKTIAVSILPLKYIIENITGNDIEIEVLVPPGASPETYEVTPSQMIAISKAQLVVTTGLIDFEKQLAAKLTAQDNDNTVVDLSIGIDLIGGHNCADHQHNSHQHAHGGIDPHIWSSPRNLKIMAANLYNRIALLYPDSIKYKDNFERFNARIDSVDIAVKQKIDASDIKYFIVYHPAFTYFARDYGITQVSLEDEGKEPSADRLKALITDARRDKITKVFYQSQFNRSTVQTFATEIGAECIGIDPLCEDAANNILHITDLITSK